MTPDSPRRAWHIGTTGLWVLGLVLVLYSARYFLIPPFWLTPPALASAPFLQGPIGSAALNVAPYLYGHHPAWLLLHIAGGGTTLMLGLFQFNGTLRRRRPRLHRALGRVYLVAVLVAGVTGLPLSFLVLDALPPSLRPQFYPLVAGFASLSIVWPLISAVAFQRARQRRFDDHRAWMTRSYSLTFAAVTVRLMGPVLLVLTGDLVFALNGAILSWPLNLVVAEWLIRRAHGTRVTRDGSRAFA